MHGLVSRLRRSKSKNVMGPFKTLSQFYIYIFYISPFRFAGMYDMFYLFLFIIFCIFVLMDSCCNVHIINKMQDIESDSHCVSVTCIVFVGVCPTLLRPWNFLEIKYVLFYSYNKCLHVIYTK